MKKANWWKSQENGNIKCLLCPKYCIIEEGKTGFCKVRKNIKGNLVTLVYNNPIALHIDPIEKKPLYHFFPGSQALSVGTVGCNLACEFCQNADIAQFSGDVIKMGKITADQIVQKALDTGCKSIAFTYNEPTVFGEYVIDIAKKAHSVGLKTIMVSNGYISEEAIEDIYQHIDAANIDLKSFSSDFYNKLCKGKLDSVLAAITKIQKLVQCLEITTLIIPGKNDSNREIGEISGWISKNLGTMVPLHLSAFHPSHKMLDVPRTTKSTIDQAREIAHKNGLNYIYEGNVVTNTEDNTYCHNCGKLLIERQWFSVVKNELLENTCLCGTQIPIVQ